MKAKNSTSEMWEHVTKPWILILILHYSVQKIKAASLISCLSLLHSRKETKSLKDTNYWHPECNWARTVHYECKEWHINPQTILDAGSILQCLAFTEPAVQEKESPREKTAFIHFSMS